MATSASPGAQWGTREEEIEMVVGGKGSGGKRRFSTLAPGSVHLVDEDWGEDEGERRRLKGPADNAVAIAKYFVFGLTYSILGPLLLVLVSGVGAVVCHFYLGMKHEISYQPFTPAQTVLGFLVGFYLNHAFDRNQKALEAVQSMSVALQSLGYLLTGYVYDNYLHDFAEDLSPEAHRNIETDTNEAIALVKYYYISCCTDLNVASLLKEGASIDRAAPIISLWETIRDGHIQLSAFANQQLGLLIEHFQSGVHFDLLAQQWILHAVYRLSPGKGMLKDGANHDNDGHDDGVNDNDGDEENDAKVARRRAAEVLIQMGTRWSVVKSEVLRQLTAARNAFLTAHKIANGRTSPVHFWLLGMLMFVLCICMPWVVVADYGYFCVVPALFLTYIFFGARQIGSDFWEPFGTDAAGLVDVDLQRACEQTCDTLDQMIPFHRGVHQLREAHDRSYAGTHDHNVLMKVRRSNAKV